MCGNKERAKNDIRIDLMSWIRDKYPGHAIIGISDYSAAEAEAIKQKTGINITWGMYVALEEGDNSEFGDISFMLQSPTKQIADGNHKTQQEITGEETSSP